jgi:CheY-like chemotaxis protein
MLERNPLDGERGRESGRRGTILVVDDDSDLRCVVRQVLEEDHLTVIEAKDGLEGVETFRRDPHRFCAVVMDVEMPRMNGIDAFREMRAIRTDIPVIVASGSPPEEYQHRLPAADRAWILSKPFSLKDLLRALSRIVSPEGIQNMRRDRA